MLDQGTCFDNEGVMTGSGRNLECMLFLKGMNHLQGNMLHLDMLYEIYVKPLCGDQLLHNDQRVLCSGLSFIYGVQVPSFDVRTVPTRLGQEVAFWLLTKSTLHNWDSGHFGLRNCNGTLTKQIHIFPFQLHSLCEHWLVCVSSTNVHDSGCALSMHDPPSEQRSISPGPGSTDSRRSTQLISPWYSSTLTDKPCINLYCIVQYFLYISYFVH